MTRSLDLTGGQAVLIPVLIIAVVPSVLVAMIRTMLVTLDRRPGRAVAARGPGTPQRSPDVDGILARTRASQVEIDERDREVRHARQSAAGLAAPPAGRPRGALRHSGRAIDAAQALRLGAAQPTRNARSVEIGACRAVPCYRRLMHERA